MSFLVKRAYRSLRAGLVLLGIEPASLRKHLLPTARAFDECSLVHEWFASQKQHSGVMIDVGVAWGSAAKPFLKMGWSVHGFEPDISESKAERIDELRSYNEFFLHNNAVSESSGVVLDFYQSPESEGISSLHDFRKHEISHQVTTISLDDFFSNENVKHVDFLKIDVEGHEKWVLKGLNFDNVSPSILVLEFDDQKTVPLDYTWQDLADTLELQGYAVLVCEWYPIVKYGSMHSFRSIDMYPCTLANSAGWGNLIAVKKDYLESFLSFTRKKLGKRFVRFT